MLTWALLINGAIGHPSCNGGNDCCTSSNQCGINEGDCDSDNECKVNLVCGRNNCVGDTFDSTDDCCTNSSK